MSLYHISIGCETFVEVTSTAIGVTSLDKTADKTTTTTTTTKQIDQRLNSIISSGGVTQYLICTSKVKYSNAMQCNARGHNNDQVNSVRKPELQTETK